MKKYKNLAREILRLWKTSANVILVVVGAVGPVASLVEYMSTTDIERVQLSALLGRARILKKSDVLDWKIDKL